MNTFTFNKVVTDTTVNYPLNFVFNNDAVDDTLLIVESGHLSKLGCFVNNVEVHVDYDACTVANLT